MESIQKEPLLYLIRTLVGPQQVFTDRVSMCLGWLLSLIRNVPSHFFIRASWASLTEVGPQYQPANRQTCGCQYEILTFNFHQLAHGEAWCWYRSSPDTGRWWWYCGSPLMGPRLVAGHQGSTTFCPPCDGTVTSPGQPSLILRFYLLLIFFFFLS